MKNLTAFAVMLMCNAAVQATETVPETVTVPVLVRSLAAGDSFDGATEPKALPKGQVFAGTVRDEDELRDSVAGRDMQAGKPVLRLQVKQDFPVSRNSSVSFVLKRGGISLNGVGTALEDGALGSTIKMMNPATRSTLAAVVVGPGQVEVR